MKFAVELTTSKLDGPIVVPASALTDLFRKGQALEHLELASTRTVRLPSRTGPVTLNRLATFLARTGPQCGERAHPRPRGTPEDLEHRFGAR